MSDEQAAKDAADRLPSRFADDPEMAEIVAMFVEEMPQRVAELRSCFEGKDLERLTRLAHQLKGAGGGYGYFPLGEAAGKLEQTLKILMHEGSTAAMSRLQREFDELLSICQRVSVR